MSIDDPALDGLTLLGAVLYQMAAWQRLEGRACGLIIVSAELMAGLKLEAVVWPVGPRDMGDLGELYLERIPGVPAEFLVDRTVEGHVCSFQPMPDLERGAVSM